MFFSKSISNAKALFHEYPRPFWTVVLVTFIDRLGGSLLFPFFALYLTRRFNVGMVEVGGLFAMWSISGFFGNALGGAMADRFGRKGMLIISLVTSSLSTLVMGFVNSMDTFYTLALVAGVFGAAGGPAHEAIVADLLPEEKRAEGYGIIRVGFNLSVTLGPAIGGLLAGYSYLLLFVLDAIISLIAATIIFFTLPETKPAAKPGDQPETVLQTFGGYGTVLRDGIFMLFVGAVVLMNLVYMNMNTTLGVYLRDQHGTPDSGYGYILSLNALMVVLMQFGITRRIRGYAPFLMMALGTALYAVGFAMYGFVSSYSLFLLAMVIITLGEMVVAPVSQALSAGMAPENKRGRYMAVMGFGYGLTYGVGPILAGILMDQQNPRWLWYVSGIVGLLAVVVYLALHRLRSNVVSPSPI